jgi:hypothetical protein
VTIPSGNWAQALPGVDRDVAEMTVDASGAVTAKFGVDFVTNPDRSINYCATATIPKLTLDASGHFDVSGTIQGRGTGLTDGPVVPVAQFSGTVTGNTMVMTVTNTSGVWGRFTLTQGAPFIGELICID